MRILSKFTVVFFFMLGFLTSTSLRADHEFTVLDQDLKVLAESVDTVDHKIAAQDISEENVQSYLATILKAIDAKDPSFFAKIKQHNAIGMTGLTCLADCINAMAPQLRAKMRGVLRNVVPLIGYGAHTVDLFIDK